MPTSSREDFVNGLLTAFVGLARKYPDAKLVFSGGAASLTHPELKETLVARQLFSDLGLDTSRVIFEDRARKTSENAILTYALGSTQAGPNLAVDYLGHSYAAIGRRFPSGRLAYLALSAR